MVGIEQQQQAEPCVALHLNENGVELTVAAQLQQGAANWTPQEAGDWFARNWQEAQQALWVCAVHRLASEPGTQLVRQGEMPWYLTPIPQPEPAPEPIRLEPAVAEPPAVKPPAKRPELVRVPEPDVAPPEEKPASGVEAAEAQQRVLSVLARNGRPVSTSDLKRMTEMSDYRVRRALRELSQSGAITEEMRDAGAGRWKEIAYYSLKES